MKRFVWVTAALLLSATPAFAQTWNVDHAKSKLVFSVPWGGEPFVAVFKTWKADIAFDPKDLAHAKASVTIDLGSLASDSPENDTGLKSVQGFGVSKYPQAKFETSTFKQTKPGSYIATGTLALHGASKPVILPFTLTINGKTAHMVGQAMLMRPDFGLARDPYAGDTPVSRSVSVDIDLTATQTP